MISTNEVNTLISNLEKINNILEEHGVKDAAIYKPISYKEAGKLNFVVFMTNYESADIQDIFDIEAKLSNVLGCEVTFISEDAIDDNFRAFIAENKCILKLNNAEKIKSFITQPWLYNNHISNMKEEYPNNVSTQPDTQAQIAKILEYLHANEDVWEILTDSPKILHDLNLQKDTNLNILYNKLCK